MKCLHAYINKNGLLNVLLSAKLENGFFEKGSFEMKTQESFSEFKHLTVRKIGHRLSDCYFLNNCILALLKAINSKFYIN